MTFEPKYIEYHKRVRKNLLKILFLAILFGIIFFFLRTHLNKEIVIIFLSLYMLTVAINFRTDRIYLKSVLLENEILRVITVNKDKEIEALNIPISQARIFITEKPFVLFNSYFGRNFKLVFQDNLNGQFRIAIEQSECHEWNYKTFKEVYSEYCKQKNVVESITST